MSRKQEIEEFLKYLSKIYIQNPSLPITLDTIYNELMNYGVPEEEKELSIYDNFKDWKMKFLVSKNLNVFLDDRQKHFLQFESKNSYDYDGDFVKLYLTFPPDKINECVSEIFKFIDKNEMMTCSKVSDIIRADSVILRMCSVKDAKEVIEFIKNNPNIYNNIRTVNPFLMKNGKIGMACDNDLSYNEGVALVVSEYLKKCKDNNKLNQVSYNSFLEFANSYNYDVFKNCNKLQEFFNKSEVQAEKRRLNYYNISDGSIINNYSQIFELLLISLNENSNEIDYFNHFEKCNNKLNQKQFEKYYEDILNRQQGPIKSNNKYEETKVYYKFGEKYYELIGLSKKLIEQHKTLSNIKLSTFDNKNYFVSSEINDEDKLRLLAEAIGSVLRLGNEFADDKYFKNSFSEFKLTGSEYESSIHIANYEKNNGQLDKAISLLEQKAEKVLKLYSSCEEKYNNSLNEKTKLLDSYIIYANQKYGKEGMLKYLGCYIDKNHLASITRDNNFRELFSNNLSPDIIKHITNKDIISYTTKVLNKSKDDNKSDNFEINNFVFSKFEDLKNLLDSYILYATKKYGREGMLEYLECYIDKNHIDSITRDYNFRELFRNNLSPKLINIITNNDIYSYVNNILNAKLSEQQSEPSVSFKR